MFSFAAQVGQTPADPVSRAALNLLNCLESERRVSADSRQFNMFYHRPLDRNLQAYNLHVHMSFARANMAFACVHIATFVRSPKPYPFVYHAREVKQWEQGMLMFEGPFSTFWDCA
jgi:hypothetical protein